MTNLRTRVIAITGIVLALLVGACGGAEGKPGSPRVLSTEEAKKLLLQLPYRYKFRKVKLPEGASGALAGKAIGGHHTVVNFGIALGREPEPVPVPLAGTRSAYYYWGGGFVYTHDMVVRGKDGKLHAGKQYQTDAQWYEAADMVVAMQQKLCKASTGELCPV